MQKDQRLCDLMKLYAGVDEGERTVIDKLLTEAVFLEERLEDLRKLPFIEVHPKRPELQRATAAARQYKECAATYSNIIRILINVLRKTDTDEQNELLKKLEEFAQ